MDEMTIPEPTENKLNIPSLNTYRVQIPVVGVTPLICNYFDPESKKDFIISQNGGGKAKTKKENRTPAKITREFENSRYRFSDTRDTDGFPAAGFKAAMVRAAKSCGIAMTDAKAFFHVIPDGSTLCGIPLVEINGKPVMREDHVNQRGTPNLVYRAGYNDWSAKCHNRI